MHEPSEQVPVETPHQLAGERQRSLTRKAKKRANLIRYIQHVWKQEKFWDQCLQHSQDCWNSQLKLVRNEQANASSLKSNHCTELNYMKQLQSDYRNILDCLQMYDHVLDSMSEGVRRQLEN